MGVGGRSCAFCGATAETVPTCVLDEKWSHRFGGDPVVALDHGWYSTARGERVAADHVDPGKFFGPYVRALCDYCVHGWVEDVRWRAEPALLALASGRPLDQALAGDPAALVRWAQVTAMLAERVEAMPHASSAAQRDAVRRGAAPDPPVGSWLFATRQRLPARVHLSQVAVAEADADPGLVQVVSVDLAHLSVLVVLPSDAAAADVVERSGVAATLGPPLPRTGEATLHVHPLDLSSSPHPHRVAVQRLCTTSSAHPAAPQATG